MVSPDSTPSQKTRRRERAVLLSEALAQLPEDYREVLILREFEGMSLAQVSEQMGRSVNSVKNLWVRGVMKMRRLMNKYDL